MGKRAELEQAAIRLYAEGIEIPQINKELGVSENSLREWKKRAGREWDEARASCRKGYVASFEEVGARLRRSREISDRLSGNIASQGNMGVVLNEALRTMMFDIMNQVSTSSLIDPESMTATIDQLNKLAMVLQRAEAAAALNQKMAFEVRKEALEQAEKKASAAVDALAGGGKQMSAEDFKRILKDTYGF